MSFNFATGKVKNCFVWWILTASSLDVKALLKRMYPCWKHSVFLWKLYFKHCSMSIVNRKFVSWQTSNKSALKVFYPRKTFVSKKSCLNEEKVAMDYVWGLYINDVMLNISYLAELEDIQKPKSFPTLDFVIDEKHFQQRQVFFIKFLFPHFTLYVWLQLQKCFC